MTETSMRQHRVISRLLESRRRDGDSIAVSVCRNSAGTQWLRIERRSHDGRECSINLPTRLAGLLGETLARYADRETEPQ